MSSPVPRSILLPSPIHKATEYPARFPPHSPISAPEGRRRTSITIDERPRIVVRPLVDTGSQRRDRRRSSTVSNTGNPSKGLETDEVSVTRKPSAGNMFASLFSGRRKKSSRDDAGRKGLRGKDTSMESLEGEIVDRSHVQDQYSTLHAARTRANSAVPGTDASTSTIRLAAPAAPIRRVSESDAETLTQRPRPPMLHLHTAPYFPEPQTPTSSTPNAQPRRRSSTRLASPSLSTTQSRRTSSRPTSPSSPGFTAFRVFTASPREYTTYTGMGSPRSPMAVGCPSGFRPSAISFPQNPVPFSLTIRPDESGSYAEVPPPTVTTPTHRTKTDSETPRQTVFDPAQFEDGSDGETWLDKLAPLIALSTPPPTSTASAFPSAALPSPPSVPRTPVLEQQGAQRVSIVFDNAPLMSRSDSGPPPTFKVIPATPIVPPDEAGASPAVKDAEIKQKKARASGPPVPVNPVRPRMLALLLDDGPKVDKGGEHGVGAVSLLGSEVFQAGSESDESTNTSPVLPPVRSPSAESLQRNTAPLRLAHSPRLVKTGLCHPVQASLSMSSSLQSSHALTLSSSSTVGSSLDSFDGMDLDDVESALGTMLASLSTRPSLADRLVLDDPTAPGRRKTDMGLSALGFGVPDQSVQTETSPRDFFSSLDFPPGETTMRDTPIYRASDASDDEDADINGSETDSIFSDIDDLGSVSIAVVQKQTQAVFASPRTVSIGDSGMERLRH